MKKDFLSLTAALLLSYLTAAAIMWLVFWLRDILVTASVHPLTYLASLIFLTIGVVRVIRSAGKEKQK